MIVCQQCNGKGVTKGTESIVDINQNSEPFHPHIMHQAAIPCSQCNGKGYQTFGNGA